jgi:hypothetical protein
MKQLFAILALALFAGCTTAPVNYYYGDYSRSLYRSKKDTTPASLAKHRATLEDIIQKSEKRGSRVPPGIFCEYAYLLAKDGSPEADRYFALEVESYPESKRFVDFIRAQLKN